MALSVSGLTVHTQVGTGTWKDYGGGGGSSSNTDVFVSSTSSRGRKVSNGIKGFALEVNASGTDLSGTCIAIRWATLAGVGSLDSLVNSGVVIRLEDTSGNTSDWAIHGNDTYAGGFTVSVISTTTSETSNSGTAASLTAIRYVGIVWDETGSVGGGDPNCYIDEVISWPDAGLTLTGDSTALVADLQTFDDANDYGIFETRSEQTFSIARLILSPGASDFASTGETLIFEDPFYYDGTNTSSGLDEIGLESSDADVIQLNRLTCIAATNPDVDGTAMDRIINFSSATAIDVNIATFRGFDGATTPLQLGGTGNAYNDTAFESCGQATQTGAVIRDCVFRNTTNADGAYEWTTTADLENTTFESDGTGHGIDIASAPTDPTTTDFTGIIVTNYGANNGADAFVDNNTGHDVAISAVDSSTITVNTTTNTSVTTSVSVSFEAVDKDDNAISGVQVSAYLVSDDTEVILQDTNGSGIASGTFGGSTPADIYYRYRKASSGDTKYINLSGFGTIATGTGVTIKRSMTVDSNNNT